jgi:GT2 family glycosyltransferase
MNVRTAVIVATKGRPWELSKLLDALAQQSVHPDLIVVSACERSDISPNDENREGVKVLFGHAGSTAQRNRALQYVANKYDIVVFFDDDFVPSHFWIERIQLLMKNLPDVASITGQLLVDGSRATGVDWARGRAMVDERDALEKTFVLDKISIDTNELPYGCNMAFRAKSIEDLTFDERLVLYGWLEDRDFGHRVGSRGSLIQTDAVWGAHLGSKQGRTTGVRYGYSQVVNPWYLMKKGTGTFAFALTQICRALARNTIGSVVYDPHIDRPGRLRGNLVGIKDIVSGRWAPERIIEF